MKRKFIILPLLFVTFTAVAETALIIQPLTGEEQAKSLAKIGYVKVKSDSLYIYSQFDDLLLKNAIRDIRYIYYGDKIETPTSLESSDSNEMQKNATIKVLENDKVLIKTPTGTYNIQGKKL